jgi:hypothetical protein
MTDDDAAALTAARVPVSVSPRQEPLATAAASRPCWPSVGGSSGMRCNLQVVVHHLAQDFWITTCEASTLCTVHLRAEYAPAEVQGTSR